MHIEFKDMPACLYWRNIARIQILCDLINISQFQSSAVVSFVNVLVDVFDCLDRSTYFHINVTIILAER